MAHPSVAVVASDVTSELRRMIDAENFYDGTRFVGDQWQVGWVVRRRQILAGLADEVRALAGTAWPGDLDGLLDRCEAIRGRIPPRDPPDDFDDEEIRAIRLHRAATYRAASVEARQNLEAGLAEVAPLAIRRARSRLEDALQHARAGMRQARSEEQRRAATGRVHQIQQGLAAIRDAEVTPPADPVAVAARILAAAERAAS